MEQKLKFYYSDSMDLLNALESLSKALKDFGVKMEILNGGDGYEEVQLSKVDNG
jgi:hypothetical protein